ncbi:MAG: F-type H+-transporting ATPase subunit gamma [Candidatus Promineifilaceae bacterium]|jgi:F-type H+-transporting ATPase subunit gamma
MATERELKQRINSVANTSKITSALAAISASKANRAQGRVSATRDYANKAFEILNNLAGGSSAVSHPMLVDRQEIKSVAIIAFTGDRGLAGAYNTDIVRLVERFIEKIDPETTDVKIVAVGKKGRDMFIRRGFNVIASFIAMPDPPSSNDISPIAQVVVNDYLDGKVDQVFVAYTDFLNMVTRYARMKQLLPLSPTDFTGSAIAEFFEAPVKAADSGQGGGAGYTYEPPAEDLLDAIVPRFVDLQLYQSYLESLASEHSARYVAMNNATDNAKALIDDLTLARNKARQTAITAEILDIVGGASALAD